MCLLFEAAYFAIYLIGAVACHISVVTENVAFVAVDVVSKVINPPMLAALFVMAESAVASQGHTARWKVCSLFPPAGKCALFSRWKVCSLFPLENEVRTGVL